MQESTALTKKQKEAVGILSIGTFLEYFDLMLYVHMAIFLNELFFPESDAHSNALITAFAFCSTYLMRPLGALIFGYIGDNIGRKHTVVITTFLMALSSFAMFLLPTYAQIGIASAWAVTICRMIQGMSSMGEIIGAVLYLTELIPAPKSYQPVALIRVLPGISTLVALGVATISLKYDLNWRYAFLFGAGIALIGVAARTSLRETPDFVDARKRFLNKEDKKQIDKVSKKTAISYLFLECAWPLWVYVIYIHYGSILKNDFGYTAADVVEHNLYITIFGLLSSATIVYLAGKVHPFQIMLGIAIIFSVSFPVFLLYFYEQSTVFSITFLQLLMMSFYPTSVPADPIIFKHFPVLKRFLATSMLYSISRLLIYFTTSFGTVYLTKYLGASGLLFLIVPVMIGYFYGLNTFINLEAEAGTYHKKSFWSITYLNQKPFQESKSLQL